MLFSSTVFIFIFLPCLLAAYYMIPARFVAARNVMLLIASLIFYAWGEPRFVLLMLTSIVCNYFLGRIIGSSHGRGRNKTFVLGVVFNLVLLFVFKYLNFVIRIINVLLRAADCIELRLMDIELPIGISFFTFQALSYLIDVWRRDVKQQKNILSLGLYISFFPQLIAGPIVRYADFCEQITDRKSSVEKFNAGCSRFIYGLAKKVILANNVALVADVAFASIGMDEAVLLSWLGMVAYTLQIYFDFSGYSDMAIGLAGMFGFDIMENFNYPYAATSISDFWRRWHISLGSWFRDYIYIPLGGSRVDRKWKLARNLFIVWTLTGIWHGANWNFIAWGSLYGVLISIEKLAGLPGKFQTTAGRILYQIFTLLCIMSGWVLFRADGLQAGIQYLTSLTGISSGCVINNTFIEYFGEYKVFIIAAVGFSVPAAERLWRRFSREMSVAAMVINAILCVFLLVVSISYIVLEAYNPFIYFNF